MNIFEFECLSVTCVSYGKIFFQHPWSIIACIGGSTHFGSWVDDRQQSWRSYEVIGGHTTHLSLKLFISMKLFISIIADTLVVWKKYFFNTHHGQIRALNSHRSSETEQTRRLYSAGARGGPGAAWDLSLSSKRADVRETREGRR